LTQNQSAVLEIIQACIVKVDPSLAKIPLVRGTNFVHLGVPSIVMITIVFEIEEQFDIVIVDAGLDDFDTIGDLQDLVLSLLARKVAS
jgi:acyl carrier protein